MGDERGVSGDAGEGGVEAREGDGQWEGELRLFEGKKWRMVEGRENRWVLELGVLTGVPRFKQVCGTQCVQPPSRCVGVDKVKIPVSQALLA